RFPERRPGTLRHHRADRQRQRRRWERSLARTGPRRLVAARFTRSPSIALCRRGRPWTLRTGSIPFWMLFNTEPSARALAAYLDRAGRFDEIALMLFSHGVESVGLAGIERWRALLDSPDLCPVADLL